MEQAVQYFRQQINTEQGTAAREYLNRRGLKQDALERWCIGYAPNMRHGLFTHFREIGVAEDLMVAAGLATLLAQGGLYAQYWNRQSGGFIRAEAAE